MHQQGILKTDDLITRFFRLSTEMCVDLTYGTLKSHSSNAAPVRAKCFQTLDAYVRLIVLLVKLSGDATNTLTKLNLLNKVNVFNELALPQYHWSYSAPPFITLSSYSARLSLQNVPSSQHSSYLSGKTNYSGLVANPSFLFIHR